MIEIAPNLPNAMFSLGLLLHCMHLYLLLVSFHECILYTPHISSMTNTMVNIGCFQFNVAIKMQN